VSSDHKPLYVSLANLTCKRIHDPTSTAAENVAIVLMMQLNVVIVGNWLMMRVRRPDQRAREVTSVRETD